MKPVKMKKKVTIKIRRMVEKITRLQEKYDHLTKMKKNGICFFYFKCMSRNI